MNVSRYNLRSKQSQLQARIDAQREAARREGARRAALHATTVNRPTFRGAALELQSVAGKHFEVVISGPAETGKTFACCYLLDQLLRTHRGLQAVLARKVRDTLVPTVVQTYLKVLGASSDVVAYGGKKPEWFDYSNGSRLWLAGLDDPGKALSSERDIVYVNQAEELSVGDWETLGTRATGRAGNAPFSLMLGDCNPSGRVHWITQRKSIYLLRSYHKDNPTLFNDRGEITPQGEKSLGILANLSEPRRSRLFLGLWSSAEGQVYPQFDPDVHVIPRFDIPQAWPRIRVIDFGYNDPFVCKWYAYDSVSDRLYRYREIYMTERLVEDHARQIGECEGWKLDTVNYAKVWKIPFDRRENVIATICDHDREDRATLERYGILNVAAFKAIKIGVEAVQARLKERANGDRGIYYLENSLVEEDTRLKELYLPTCTEDEFEGYVWEKAKDGKPSKEIPVDKLNHGMDTDRYAVCFIDDIGRELENKEEVVDYEEDYEISPI